MTSTPNGLQMLMKAMGFDPQLVILKAQELEQLFMQFGSEVQSKVVDIDARMTRIESMLVAVLTGQQQQGGPVQQAGECSHVLPPVLIELVETEKERKPNGRYTGD